MRFTLLPVLAAALAVSGCVATVPGATVTAQPPVVVTPAPTAPTPAPTTGRVPDSATARTVVNAEMAKRLPGRNIGPVTDCVVANASQAELADLAAMQGKPAAADAVASIVKRPATSQCIAKAAVA